MKNIFRISIILSVLFISQEVKAHQPDVSSTMLVEQGENKWVLQVRAALTAFEYEVHQHFGKDAYKTPEEFNELVLKHVQEHISIMYNGSDVAVLQNGIVKLGHETSVAFEVIGTPKDFETIKVRNSSFNDISRNKSVLIIYKKDYAKDQFVLDTDNGHVAELKVGDARFELVSETQERASYFLAILVFMGLGLVGLYFIGKYKLANDFKPVSLNFPG